MQQIVDRFSSAADIFGLKINISKTELLYHPPPMSIELPETIPVHDEPLKTTESFTYLGSTVTNTNSAGLEVERRIQSATKTYGAIQKRLWSCNDTSTKTKVKVCLVAVIPCLLYSIECTTLYRRYIMALTRLQLRHLHSILNIKWQDRITDVEVLHRANTVSVEALITVHSFAGQEMYVGWPISGYQKLCSTRNYAKVKGAMEDKTDCVLKMS